jgi:exopolysaccharide biosynthesis polyprenyl glycosylphosphotransferase
MLRSEDAQVLAAPSTTFASGKPTQHWTYLLLILTDTVAIGIGLVIAYLLRFQTGISFFHDSNGSVLGFYARISVALIPTWLFILAIFQLYNSKLLFGGLEEYARVFNACTTGVMAVMVASFLLPDLVIARGWLLVSWFSVTGMVSVGRFSVRRMVYHMRARGRFLTTMLVVGTDGEAKAIAEQIANNPNAGVVPLGFVDDNLPKGTQVLPGLRVLGSTNSLRGLVQQFGIQELTISSSGLSREKLLDVFNSFSDADDVNVRLSSGLYEIMTTGVQVRNIGQVPLLSVNRVRLSGGDVVLKSILDYAGATLGLIVLSPLLLLIGIAIKRDSPGPVFHRRRVVGARGKRFDAFKFRTMVANADEVLEQKPELKSEYQKNFKLKDDPRVTTMGKLLRKTSIDELPQLINVLRGEMSIVGPRMIVEDEIEKYGKWGTNLLTVKPGITGLWQVSGRADIDYEERVRLDMNYIRNYTIWLDLQILFQTIPAVLRKKGAY